LLGVPKGSLFLASKDRLNSVNQEQPIDLHHPTVSVQQVRLPSEA
jgi:hypothetical protein